MGEPWVWEAGGRTPLWRIASFCGAGAAAVFSSRIGGCSPSPWDRLNLGLAVGDEPERVEENRRRFAVAAGFSPAATAWAHQVHGGEVALVEAPGGAGEVDGLCTDRPGLVLTISAADCAVLYLWDARHGALGLCHAGWRGTAANVAGHTVAALTRAWGSDPADLVAAVSPCIGPCCYEVDAPVIEALAGVPWVDRVLRPGRAGHARLDLGLANRLRLQDAGVPAAAIAVAGVCTACHPEGLFSHRRDRGRTGRQQGALWRPA